MWLTILLIVLAVINCTAPAIWYFVCRTKWTNVSKSTKDVNKLPKKDGVVLGLLDNGFVCMVYFKKANIYRKESWTEMWGSKTMSVTYWTPLVLPKLYQYKKHIYMEHLLQSDRT